MGKFTPTRRGNPCVICDDASGKCRHHGDREIHLCMTYADARFGEIQNGYKCIKPDSGKGWTSWKLDNTEEWTDQQRIEWKARNEQRRQLQTTEDEQRRQRSLSALQRHEQYTRLLSELTLHPDDRADLIRRGFSHEQMELAGFRSIGRYQQLRSRYSELLPGISTGNRLIIADDGYLCPVRNADGLVTACQVRLRSLPTAETSRYRWLSGGEQTLHLYPEGCKSSGELPLAVFHPQGTPEGIALAEGTGAKPFLVSQRLNLLTIGAAGGQWASSPELFRLTLEKAQVEVTAKEIKIFPDAGDILNQSVMSRWKRVISLLEECGWEVAIGWWGQTDKTHPDIDELTNYSKIEFIKPEEFLTLRKLGFAPEPEWKVKAKAAWRRNRQFNADIKEATEWCSFSRPAANTIAFYKAGLGRGKTTQLRAWVKKWKQLEDVSFLCLGYRNTLLLQLCGDDKEKEGKKPKGLGFYHLHEHSGMAMKSAPGEGIALCVDSLWRFSPEDFDGKIIILDEVKSVVKHLLHSTTIKNRDKIISLFAEAIRRSRQVICLDGLMSDWVVDYLHSLAPEKQIIRAENTYLGEKPRLNFLLGTAGIDNKVRVNDRSPWLKFLLEDSPMPAVCSDSQVMIEALDELLTAKGLKVLRIDSKTVSEQYVKDCLLNCDAYIEQHRPDVLLYTPSAESGVDVSITNHFTHHFAFFFGVLDIDGILQMIGRIRDNITKFVWCKSFVADDEKQHSSSPFTEIIAKSINEILIGDISTSLDDNWIDKVGNHLKTVIANSLDQNFRTSCIIKSVQNFEKSNLRECLKEVLLESGYKVVDCTLDSHEESGKKGKEATEQVKRQNCSDIFNAEKIAPELVDELRFDATWQERCKLIQAKLRERLPGIDESTVWSEDFIYLTRYDDRNFINNLENYWLFTHPDVAKRQSQDNLHWMARRLHTFIGNVRSRWARIHALLEMGFERFLDPEKEWSNDNAEVIALVKQGKKYSNQLGKHPGKSTPVQFLGNLLGLFGLRLKSKKDSEGKRWYRLDQEVLTDPIRQQVLTCIEAKLTQPKEEIDWEAAINEAHGVLADNQPQTQTEQASEGTAPSPNFLYTNQVEGAVNKLDLESHPVMGISEGGSEPTPIDELVEAFPRCDTLESFAAVVEWYDDEVIADAIALQDSQPRRQLLWAWLEELSQSESTAGEKLAQSEVAIANVEDLSPSDRTQPIAQLREVLLYCHALDKFVIAIRGYTSAQIEAAIVSQDSAPHRHRLLNWFEMSRENLTSTRCQIEDGGKQPDRGGLQVGNLVKFTNPDNLPQSRIFEDVVMKIKSVVGGLMAICELPNGCEQSFGIRALTPAM